MEQKPDLPVRSFEALASHPLPTERAAISIEDAARFAISVPRTPGKDPAGSEAFENICYIIRMAAS